MLRIKNVAGELATKNSAAFLKAEQINDDGSFEGYASIFGNVDSYGEIVDPGAFGKSLAAARREKRSVKLLWQHDHHQPIGVWDELAEDERGLKGKGRLLVDASPRAREAYGLLKEGAIDGLSIGYRVIEAEPDKQNPSIIRLKKLDLREVSIVTFAANERARVETVKTALAANRLPALPEFEGFLREAGFSKSQATAIASKGLAPLLRSESGAAPEMPAVDGAAVADLKAALANLTSIKGS